MEEHMYRTLYCISLIRTINLDLIREMQKGVSVESMVFNSFDYDDNDNPYGFQRTSNVYHSSK